MANNVQMIRYKLSRARQLGNLRFARWLLTCRFRPDVILTTRILEDVLVQYRPQGNVCRDLYLGQFEYDVMDFLLHRLKPGMVVFDVGANIGVFSLLSAKCVGEGGSVHSFEPTPATFAQLRSNVELNRFSSVHLNRLAVADRSAKTSLYLYEQDAMNSLSRQGWAGKSLGQVEVEAITLDEYVNAKGLRRVDLIKLDVEGAELAVLKGAVGLLSGSNPPAIVCEFADKTTRNFGYLAVLIRDFLESLGYHLFRWAPGTANLVPEPAQQSYEIYANVVCIKE